MKKKLVVGGIVGGLLVVGGICLSMKAYGNRQVASDAISEITDKEAYVNELNQKLDELGAAHESASGLKKWSLSNQLTKTKDELQTYLDENPDVRAMLYPDKK